jgi:hypothetical protein
VGIEQGHHIRSLTSIPRQSNPVFSTRAVNWHSANLEERSGSYDFNTGQAS